MHVRGQAAMLLFHRHTARHSSSGSTRLAADLAAAAQLFRDAGDDQGVALVTRHIASLDRLSGRLDDAARRYEQALAIFRKTGDHVASRIVLHSLAQVKLELTSPTPPRSCCPRRCGWPGPRTADGSRRRCCTGWARPTCWRASWPAPSRGSSRRWR